MCTWKTYKLNIYPLTFAMIPDSLLIELEISAGLPRRKPVCRLSTFPVKTTTQYCKRNIIIKFWKRTSFTEKCFDP